MTATILVVDDEPDLEALVLKGVIGGECFALATDQRGRVVPGRCPDAVSRTTASGRLGRCRAGSGCCRDHTCAGTGIDQHVATSEFASCAMRKGWNHRDRA